MITIINYGMGNLHSVLKAFRRIGVEAIVSSKVEDIKNAERLVLPGVGNFKRGMENLHKLNLIKLLNKKVLEEKTPILGVCLGMELFTKFSEEGNAVGFGWFNAKTIKLNLDKKLKIPHMGWNSIEVKKSSPLFRNIEKYSHFYFVHSYYVNCKNEKDILATTIYGKEFVSAMNKDNIFGVQFHPEKSHEQGLQILKNFVNL